MTPRPASWWRNVRVGVKLTHAQVCIVDDLVAFADTHGGAVLIERIDPEITPVARIDAPDKPTPWPLTPTRLYVTLTASNVLRDIDVSDPTKPRTLGGVPLWHPNRLPWTHARAQC